MKKALIALLIALTFVVLIYRDLISYGFMQAKGQWKVLSAAIPVNDFLMNHTVPDSLKVKLRLIQEVKRYATDSLSLKENDSYTTIFDQKGKSILWNVSAAEPFALKSYEWTFPILGSFGYKGFFDLNKAEKEEQKLKNIGLDTRLRTVGGWSTLGWFNDPILSNMLHREKGDLIELIIHELTHGTLYVKDSVDFNENLATFIGQKGAEQFITMKYGVDSEEMSSYLSERRDNELFSRHMLNGANKLDSLYSSFDKSIDEESKYTLKNKAITEITLGIKVLDFRNPRFKSFFEENLPNNAYFMAVMRYRSKLDHFENELITGYQSDLKKYIISLKANYESL